MEDFDLEFERDEWVIIRSAEVKGFVKHFYVNTLVGDVLYYVIFPYGSVYVDGCGYEADSGWFYASELREAKEKDDGKFRVWEVNLGNRIYHMIDKHKKIADALNRDILNRGRR